MTEQNPSDSTAPETVDELTGSEVGLWNVVTRSSIHQFNFATGTVTRFPGLDARPSVNDVPRPLIRIYACRVDKRGFWTMRTDGWSELIDHYWHHSGTIARIERVVDATSFLSVEPGPESEH